MNLIWGRRMGKQRLILDEVERLHEEWSKKIMSPNEDELKKKIHILQMQYRVDITVVTNLGMDATIFQISRRGRPGMRSLKISNTVMRSSRVPMDMLETEIKKMIREEVTPKQLDIQKEYPAPGTQKSPTDSWADEWAAKNRL